MPMAGASSALHRTEAKQAWNEQPDPSAAQHAGAQGAEPDVVDPIDSHALLQPGTTGAGNALYPERLNGYGGEGKEMSLSLAAQ